MSPGLLLPLAFAAGCSLPPEVFPGCLDSISLSADRPARLLVAAADPTCPRPRPVARGLSVWRWPRPPPPTAGRGRRFAEPRRVGACGAPRSVPEGRRHPRNRWTAVLVSPRSRTRCPGPGEWCSTRGERCHGPIFCGGRATTRRTAPRRGPGWSFSARRRGRRRRHRLAGRDDACALLVGGGYAEQWRSPGTALPGRRASRCRPRRCRSRRTVWRHVFWPRLRRASCFWCTAGSIGSALWHPPGPQSGHGRGDGRHPATERARAGAGAGSTPQQDSSAGARRHRGRGAACACLGGAKYLSRTWTCGAQRAAVGDRAAGRRRQILTFIADGPARVDHRTKRAAARSRKSVARASVAAVWPLAPPDRWAGSTTAAAAERRRTPDPEASDPWQVRCSTSQWPARSYGAHMAARPSVAQGALDTLHPPVRATRACGWVSDLARPSAHTYTRAPYRVAGACIRRTAGVFPPCCRAADYVTICARSSGRTGALAAHLGQGSHAGPLQVRPGGRVRPAAALVCNPLTRRARAGQQWWSPRRPQRPHQGRAVISSRAVPCPAWTSSRCAPAAHHTLRALQQSPCEGGGRPQTSADHQYQPTGSSPGPPPGLLCSSI